MYRSNRTIYSSRRNNPFIIRNQCNSQYNSLRNSSLYKVQHLHSVFSVVISCLPMRSSATDVVQKCNNMESK